MVIKVWSHTKNPVNEVLGLLSGDLEGEESILVDMRDSPKVEMDQIRRLYDNLPYERKRDSVFLLPENRTVLGRYLGERNCVN